MLTCPNEPGGRWLCLRMRAVYSVQVWCLPTCLIWSESSNMPELNLLVIQSAQFFFFIRPATRQRWLSWEWKLLATVAAFLFCNDFGGFFIRSSAQQAEDGVEEALHSYMFLSRRWEEAEKLDLLCSLYRLLCWVKTWTRKVGLVSASAVHIYLYSRCFPEGVVDGVDFLSKHKLLLHAVNMHNIEMHLLVVFVFDWC